MTNLQRTVLWRNLAESGTEYCSLRQRATGFKLEGQVVLALGDTPVYVHYEVDCNSNWHTQAASVELRQGSDLRTLQIEVDGEQRWWVAGREVEHIRGCLDIDLAVTPATNTLPIRRLDIPIGSGCEVVAAWLRFPELDFELLRQKYTRLSGRRYGYESYENGLSVFATELEVDDLGLMVEYRGLWRREAALDR
jgi:hypothetical protein